METAITAKETVPVVISAAVWGGKWAKCRVLVRSDIASGDPLLIHLLCCLHFIDPRRACAARVTVVGSVCLSVCPSMLQLTSRLFARPTNDTIYCTGSLIEPFFLDLSAATILRIQTVGHFYSAENAHAHHFLPRGVATCELPFFSLERKKFREFNLRWLSSRFVHNIKYHSS